MNEKWLKIGDSVLYRDDLETSTAIIKISREKQLNALNSSVISCIEQALSEIEKNKKIRSVIVTGAGEKAFVAGADIKEFQHFSENEAYNLSRTGKEKLFNKIANFSKPVVAAINGYALGGGLELALSCHIRIAVKEARLGLPECTLGIIPGYGATQRLPKIIGKGFAMEMILTAKIIDADYAYKIGLINHVVSSDELISKTLSITKLFNNTSPEALSLAINSVNSCFLSDADNIESRNFASLFNTDNFKEGINAFIEKRKSNFD
ncbi:MAG: enoyl-CoA hydratase [Flavobacteriales bacterium]|nr:enoyl-CoA hydratase [Flavobacteriales bacterium]|tara:strand:- start:29335 stop:30129 length:795 start_codon:yes stop_codon:yes gene_type:complete